MGEMTETVARAICAAMGEDPDGHDIMRVCNADNSPAPLWRFYEEHADAAIAALSDHVSAPDLLEALVQARGALLLDHMVDENGKPFGTTVLALEAITAAIARAKGKG